MTFTEIEARFYFLSGTTSSNVSTANLTALIGEGLKKVISLICKLDSRWQFDDSNYADLPFATLTVTSGQQQYSLATSHLTVDRIESKDSGGSWKRLKQIDQQDLKRRENDMAIALGETTPSTGRTGAYQSSSGVPTEYDLVGIRLFLFPVPNYTLAKAMRIYFTRGPLLFDYSDDKFTDDTGSATSEPGFNSLFHDLISLYAAYDYGLAKGKQNIAGLLAMIQMMEIKLNDFYGQNNRDIRPRLTVSSDSNK